MNKKRILIIVLALVAIAGFAYWWFLKRDKTDHLTSVPKDAAIVFSANLLSLADKANIEGLKKLLIYKQYEVLAGVNKEMGNIKDIIDHPVSAGFDPAAEPAVFVNKVGTATQMGIAFRILSESAFEATVRKLMKLDESEKVTEKDGIKYLSLKNEDQTIVWQGSKALLLIMSEMSSMGEFHDEEGQEPQKEIKVTDVAIDLMKQTEDKSILANKDFMDFRKKEHDFNVFMNYEKYMQMYAGFNRGMHWPGMIDISKMGDLYKGMNAGTRIVFENSRISVTSEMYYADKAAEDKMKLLGKGLTAEHLKLITNKDIHALMGFSVDMPKVAAMLSTMKPFDDGMRRIAEQLQMTKDEMLGILGGDVTMAVTDVQIQEKKVMEYNYNPEKEEAEEQEVMRKSPMPVFTATLSIKNKQKLIALMDTLMPKGAEGFWKLQKGGASAFFVAESKTGFTITNDMHIAQTIAAGKSLAELPQPSKDLASKNPYCFYMNLDPKKLPTALNEYMKEEVGMTWTKAMQYLSMFKDMQMTGDLKEARLDINMTESGDNSLYRLFEQADKLMK